MLHPNPFQTACHCCPFALRRATSEGETFHIVMTGNRRRWKSKLLDLYLFGKDDIEPNGASLRHIRNRQGPSRVDALSKATLDEAEKQLGRIVD